LQSSNFANLVPSWLSTQQLRQALNFSALCCRHQEPHFLLQSCYSELKATSLMILIDAYFFSQQALNMHNKLNVESDLMHFEDNV
jgi:hypothetical protein